MDEHVHGPLVNQFEVYLRTGPFKGSTVTVAGCCSPPWLFYVSTSSCGPLAWHPEEVAPAIEDAEEYLREERSRSFGPATAVHLAYCDPLADTA